MVENAGAETPQQIMFRQKLAMLSDLRSALRTKELVEKLPELLNDYQTKMMEQAQHRVENANFIAPLGSDCTAVKDKLASLTPPEEKEIPSSEIEPGTPSVGKIPKMKKTTVQDKEAWLSRQRTEDKDLVALIARQGSVAFVIEADKAAVEIARERLQNARVVLALKTAQLYFLAGAT
jgi:hypothetical protein